MHQRYPRCFLFWFYCVAFTVYSILIIGGRHVYIQLFVHWLPTTRSPRHHVGPHLLPITQKDHIWSSTPPLTPRHCNSVRWNHQHHQGQRLHEFDHIRSDSETRRCIQMFGWLLLWWNFQRFIRRKHLRGKISTWRTRRSLTERSSRHQRSAVVVRRSDASIVHLHAEEV